YDEGIVLCADICNTPDSFGTKIESRITWINLLEVFGIDPQKAEKRMESLALLTRKAVEYGLTSFPVPHSVYSVSLPLLRMLKEKSSSNRVTSVHFMETEGEREFIEKHGGSLMENYIESGWLVSQPDTAPDHSSAVLNEITSSGNLILVHNTFANRETVREVMKRGNTYWCLCPGSNMYIENAVPPLPLLLDEGCDIVIGTDSLASNRRLSILREMNILQNHFPSVSLEEIVRWATINGARALGEEDAFGKIGPDMRPGLILLRNIDLLNMKITEESRAERLI
ncbi:MAG TPA: amidohydrolase family protein, partial [Bacteroidales bacterium]|nr:amidohydrolase family protein [Bacteroidales bacterium]